MTRFEHDDFLLRLPSGNARIESRWIAPERCDARLLVFLHEGLGSIDAWRGWPESLCASLDCRGFVFSRQGYGRSLPAPRADGWPMDYLEREATEAMPAVLDAAGIDPARDRPVIVGHSDGGSIALHYAAAFPEHTGAVVVIAPHVYATGVNFQLIAQLQRNYAGSALQRYLAPLHDHPDDVFWRWSKRWTSPEFRQWDITASLRNISAPLLAVQGRDDQYSTLDQLYEISRRVAQAELMILDKCRHTPHLEHPAALAQRIAAFLDEKKPHPAN